ncbi:MAG: hypothetical protein AAGF24_09080 [Cyanobacteria bacterium P01_H01_bin.121]
MESSLMSGHDPKVDQVVEEIQAILKRNDLGGTIVISSRTATNFAIEFPDWLLGRLTKDGDFKLQFRSREGQTPEQQDSTCHFVLAQRDALGYLRDGFTVMAKKVLACAQLRKALNDRQTATCQFFLNQLDRLSHVYGAFANTSARLMERMDVDHVPFYDFRPDSSE